MQARKWLEASGDLFAAILDAEDSPDSATALSRIWQRSFVSAGDSVMVKHLVAVLQVGRGGCGGGVGGAVVCVGGWVGDGGAGGRGD